MQGDGRLGPWYLLQAHDDKVYATEETDYADLLRFGLAQWQVLPLVGRQLIGAPASLQESMGQGNAPDTALCERFWQRHATVSAFSHCQAAWAGRICGTLSDAGIPYVLLKGSAARFIAYRDPVVRTGHDFDIGVPRGRIYEAETVLGAIGFQAATWDAAKKRFFVADRAARRQMESHHYELTWLVRRQTTVLEPDVERALTALEDEYLLHRTNRGQPAYYITIDLHHAASLEIPITEMVEGHVEMSFGNDRLRVPPLPWLVFHLIYKLYWEGVHHYGKGGYQYADLVRLVSRLSEAEEKKLISLLRQFNLEAGGHYVLRRLPWAFNQALPDQLAAFVAGTARSTSGTKPLEMNDYGDLWPRIWGER